MLPLFDNIPTRRFPLATYALIAANFAVWFWELGSRAGRINHYAFYPCAVLFLFIFGNNVEDVTGRIRFVVFYIAGGFAAALTQTFVTLHWSGTAAASIPNVGASGAIAAVILIGAFAVPLSILRGAEPNTLTTAKEPQPKANPQSPPVPGWIWRGR